MRTVLLTALFLAFFFPVFAWAVPGEQPLVDFKPARRGLIDAGVGEEMHVFRSQDEWNAFWRRFSTQPAPVLDFTSHDLAVYLRGVQPDSGYQSFIAEAVFKGETLRITVDICTPRKKRVPSGAVTVPADAMLIPKTTRPPVWNIEVIKCSGEF